jgi:hypothetical protein
MLAGNLAGVTMSFAAAGVSWLLGHSAPLLVPAIVYPSLLLIPVSMGFTAAWVWRPLELRMSEVVLHSLSLTLVSLTGAWALFGEGAICLLIALPLLYLGVLAGAAIGRNRFRHSDRMNLCVFPLLAIAIAVEPLLREDRESIVVDEVRINAPPAKVWPHVLSFAAIPEQPGFWLFKLGLPYPVSTTSAGNFVGADRQCIFSGNAVFKEKVSAFVPLQNLTFDIIESPPDPELVGHLTPNRGQFLLRDNGDGTTTLIGSTWYTLHVRPLWYFDWWTHHIFRAVHLRVMHHVQRLAEAA